MHVTAAVLRELEERFGIPEVAVGRMEFDAREFDLVAGSHRHGRQHDVTLMIRDAEGRFAVIRKPSYPPEVFRPPSGGVEPGEAVEAGAAREAREETGLEIRLERYLLRTEVEFSRGGSVLKWSTHLFLARATGGTLDPLDRREIAEARLATVTEMVERYRPAMLAWGTMGMRYRVDLQDAALRLLGLADPPPPPGGRTIVRIP
ncbi:MAG: NUDIX domain-containing protein [Armatimonadota bacterium]